MFLLNRTAVLHLLSKHLHYQTAHVSSLSYQDLVPDSTLASVKRHRQSNNQDCHQYLTHNTVKSANLSAVNAKKRLILHTEMLRKIEPSP
jgi:hypothetical protein